MPEEQSQSQKKSVSDHPYANPVELESTPAPAQKVEVEHPEVVQARVDRVSSDHSYGTRQRLASIREETESDHAYSTQIVSDVQVQVLPVRTSQPPPGSEVIAQVSQIDTSTPKGAAKRKASLKKRKNFEPVVPVNKIPPRITPNKYNCEVCGRTFDVPYKKKRHVQEVHKKVKKHACQFCDKAFFKVSSRKRHELTHITHDTWKCSRCAKVFKDPSSLKYHMKNNVCLSKEDIPENKNSTSPY